ncbi:hypothetical protein [Beggiatoa leptomitoformis]|uniref:Uncharacterized protein n=1 Tax=Beggiatoa leptomitoformis TaxID=288004 RepID=A0A650GE29_9GAMM|nr:hypothetical protein [Beggiatoa leptomitoformis]QGX03627.1 hypothetical protein AL038_18770 [Beggiatoa leptomitoformis]QGX04069.1 hypothetical protein BLE401_18570 [Beggiatoa leptomitoformis]
MRLDRRIAVSFNGGFLQQLADHNLRVRQITHILIYEVHFMLATTVKISGQGRVIIPRACHQIRRVKGSS